MRLYRLFFLLQMLFVLVMFASAKEPYRHTGLNQDFLGKELQIVKDTASSLTYLDVYNNPDLKYGESNVLNLNFSESPYWLKLNFINVSDTNLLVLDLSYPILDSVEVYFLKEGRLVEQHKYGDDYNVGLRQYKHQNILENIHLDQGEEGTVIIKLKTKGPLLIPLKLLKPKVFFENIALSDIFKGFYLGVMLVMFFYNLIIFFITRDNNYVFYIFYILFIYLTQASLDGFTYRFFFHEYPRLYEFFLIFFPAAAGISGLQFIKKFLHVKEQARSFYPGLIIAQAIYFLAVVVMIAGFTSVSFRIVDFTAALIAIYTIIMSIKLVIKGYRPAKFFLVAWSFFLIGLVIFVLRNFGVLPFNAFTSNILQLGTSLEVVLLSIALADKINVLREEKEQSQAEALKVSKENEKIIREQNIMLEQKAQERTMELQESNEELQVTLTNLKDTQTQLVDAEKMASLGQLTAGIAHEINNPINFVTSNITPLRRDLDEIYDIMESYSSIDISNPSEGLTMARQKEDDYDFKYLKEEINSLVNGISDGATRTSEIVKGLRTFSRLDEDTIKEANVHEGIDSTIVLLRNKIKDAIELKKEYIEGMPDIDCYPGKLNQVFMNILNNAIYAVTAKKYTEGEKPIITIKTGKEGEKVRVHIIDNGIGMDDLTKKKMFDPFFTTKDVGEGTGLGMSIVFKIIEKHKGFIEVHSEKGKGSEFIITLPLRLPNQFE